MRKTSLLIVPVLAALILAGCTTTKKSGGKKKSSSVSASQTSAKTSASKTSNTTAPSGTSSKSGSSATSSAPVVADLFDMTPGDHNVTIDFGTQADDLKGGFPFVKEGTGLYDATLGNLNVKGVKTYINAGSSSYLFLKNKIEEDHGAAFIASQDSLGSIKEISIVTTTGQYGSSTNGVFNIAILDAPVTAEGGSTAGTNFTGQTSDTNPEFKVTGSGKYFCITATATKYNCQIALMTIKYTIS